MNLTQLAVFEHIAIQCHDNPDADSIAAGFGLYSYYKTQGCRATLFHGGRNSVTKPNLVKMLQLLRIPLEHRPGPETWPGLLVTVDCQYGAGNVSPMAAKEVAVIDHHIQECPPLSLHDIRPYLGSCATLVWALLREAGFPIDTSLATALYYGLFSDTNGLTEVRHPLDRDLRDSVAVNERILKILKNSNLSLDDLALASTALKDLNFHQDGRFALVSVQPCDPNILGFVGDLTMQVDAVDMALVYSEVPGGIKYSVRTMTRDAKASDIAVWLAAGELGSGGGHAEKAGGYISAHNFAAHCPELTPAGYFHRRLKEYLDAYDVIDCSEGGAEAVKAFTGTQVGLFEKLPVRLAYVPCAEVFSEQTTLHIRMLEGDLAVTAGPDTFLMIGTLGEVYPIDRRKFEATYTAAEGSPVATFTYPPVVLDKDRGTRVLLHAVARPCTGKGGGRVGAVPLSRGLKLFTRWDADNYIKGEPGDWLVWPENDQSDMYIITAAVFPCLYKALHLPEGMRADCNGIDLASVPDSVRVRKKPNVFQVRFATTAGVAETREGPVPYAAGDALVTGTAGEIWPVAPAHFMGSYQPVSPGEYGRDGFFTTLPVEALALQPQMPFKVTLAGGMVLHGDTGDWLMRYADGSYGIVGQDIFAALYESAVAVDGRERSA